MFAEGLHGVVDVQSLQILQPYNILEIRHHLLPCFTSSYVIALVLSVENKNVSKTHGGKGMTGVKTDPNPVLVCDMMNDHSEFCKVSAQRVSLPTLNTLR